MLQGRPRSFSATVGSLLIHSPGSNCTVRSAIYTDEGKEAILWSTNLWLAFGEDHFARPAQDECRSANRIGIGAEGAGDDLRHRERIGERPSAHFIQ